MNLNRELHEALGYCWHEKHAEYRGEIACTCWATFKSEEEFIQHCKSSNPNYKAEPWLVIREMKKKGLLKRFLSSIGTTTNLDTLGKMSSLIAIDTSGKLAQLALDWLKEG
jgi:hypothetical protein